MGRSRRNKYPDLGEHAIFGNEEAAAMRAELADVVARMDDLGERVNAQFTSISAHAEISRAQLSEVREEARADMERSRDLLVGLIDRLRDEMREATAADQPADQPADLAAELLAEADGEATELPPPPVAPPAHDERLERRMDTIEHTIDDVIASLERTERRQRQMAETMASFIDTIIGDGSSDDHDEPPVRLALA